ncbi:MAG TPA: RNA 2',3'-cyclic phosphodiesterase [Acidimicrobiia bacterium]|nr:RNA 2',3'-cyclic phosphodiesterase [Acidimicrobiia bacterium]
MDLGADLVGRVFLAVPIPPEIRFALAERIGDLQIPGRVAPPENWHITLRFLDTVDRVTYERFLASLDPLPETSFPLALDGFGAFPRPAKATVFWAGIGKGATQLSVLNEDAEEAALAAGLSPEERPFHPHLTLSRIRPPADVRHLLEEEIELSWRCEKLVVYRSHPGRGGARYEPIDSLDLIG